MKSARSVLALTVFLLVGGLPAALSRAQTTAAFPEKLLEGASKFEFALFYQSDLRGNFGPCG